MKVEEEISSTLLVHLATVFIIFTHIREKCMAKNCHDSSFFHFRANLTLVRQLRDRAAEGRAFGNLGNTHYLLGNFDKAVQYHEEV